MIQRFVDLRGKRVLDVGCGVGIFASAFMRYTPHVYGIDIDPAFTLEALREGRVAAVVTGQSELLPFKDASFDVVFCNEVLEHVNDDRMSAIEMVRVCAPGGRIFVFVPNRLYPLEVHGIYWRKTIHGGGVGVPLINYLPTRLRDRLVPHVRRPYTSSELRKLFADTPSRVVYHTQVLPGYDQILRRLPIPGLRRLLHATYLLERTPLRAILGISHFLVLERL